MAFVWFVLELHYPSVIFIQRPWQYSSQELHSIINMSHCSINNFIHTISNNLKSHTISNFLKTINKPYLNPSCYKKLHSRYNFMNDKSHITAIRIIYYIIILMFYIYHVSIIINICLYSSIHIHHIIITINIDIILTL